MAGAAALIKPDYRKVIGRAIKVIEAVRPEHDLSMTRRQQLYSETLTGLPLEGDRIG